MQEGYHGGGGRPKRITKDQIHKMVKNMEKSKIVVEKSDKYHKKEEREADDILRKIS